MLADGGHLVRVDVAGARQAWAAALGGAGPWAGNAHGGPAALNSHILRFCALDLSGVGRGKPVLKVALQFLPPDDCLLFSTCRRYLELLQN